MLVRLLDMKLHEPFCPSLLLPPMRTQPVVFTAVGSPFYPWQKSLWSNKSLWSVHINNVTSESFSTGKSMSFRWECIFFISETLYRLNGIFKLCSTQADICVLCHLNLYQMTQYLNQYCMTLIEHWLRSAFPVFLQGLTFVQCLSSR